jgi:hypothetical protein
MKYKDLSERDALYAMLTEVLYPGQDVTLDKTTVRFDAVEQATDGTTTIKLTAREDMGFWGSAVIKYSRVLGGDVVIANNPDTVTAEYGSNGKLLYITLSVEKDIYDLPAHLDWLRDNLYTNMGVKAPNQRTTSLSPKPIGGKWYRTTFQGECFYGEIDVGILLKPSGLELKDATVEDHFVLEDFAPAQGE